MPSRAKPGSWVSRWGWMVAIACAYLYVFPYFPAIRSANELPRVYLVKAMVDERTFAIDAGVARWGATADVSPHGAHQYSNKSPGSSLLAAPAYALARIGGEPSLGVSMWICRVVTGIVPTLAFLVLAYGFLARYAARAAVRRVVVIAYALGSMAMTYSLLYYSHQLAAVCIASAWMLVVDVADGRRGLRAAAVAGFLIGAAPLVDYQAVFAAVPIAAHGVWKLRRDPRRLVRAGAVALGCAAIPIAILLAYHAACFGSPWKTGYDASTTFAMYHQQGFLGMTELKWERFVGAMIAPDNGLLVLAPWLAIALVGFGVLAVRRPGAEGDDDRASGLACGAIALIYVLFISSLTFWRGGWEVGPRYVTAMLPFLLPPIARALDALVARAEGRRWGALAVGATAGTIVAGVAVYALSAATFPYWPDSIANPMIDVTLRLLGDGAVAPNALAATGLVGGVASLVPYLAAVGGAVAWAIARLGTADGARVGRRGLVLAAIAFAVGAGLIASFFAFPRGAPDRPYAFVRGAVEATR